MSQESSLMLISRLELPTIRLLWNCEPERASLPDQDTKETFPSSPSTTFCTGTRPWPVPKMEVVLAFSPRKNSWNTFFGSAQSHNRC